LFDTLFLRQFADEQCVVVFGYDITIEALNNYFLFLHGVNNAVVTLYQVYIGTDAGIAIEVFLALLVE
jgi:hypothetical protein